jgi:hypothetical protein
VKWRKIVVSGVEWKYHIGKISVVARCGDRKLVGKLPEVTGLDWDTIERGQWKRTTDGMITPKQIATWISMVDDPGLRICQHEHRIHTLGSGIFICFQCWLQLTLGVSLPRKTG